MKFASSPSTDARMWASSFASGWATRADAGRARRSSSRPPIFHARAISGSNEGLQLVERFTRMGPTTIKYEFTDQRSHDVDETVDSDDSSQTH